MKEIESIFKQRTCYSFLDKDVDDNILVQIYDIMKLGPTSANCSPLRIKFVKSKENRAKLIDCLMEGNKAKTLSAPVCAIFAIDTKFYEKMDYLFPHSSNLKNAYASNLELKTHTEILNSNLQAAYFMIIAKSFGLGIGPMSGYYEKAINEHFFKNTDMKVSFVCNLGYKNEDSKHSRLPRLDFTKACSII